MLRDRQISLFKFYLKGFINIVICLSLAAEDDIKVEEEKEVIEVVLPKDSATKGE